MGVINTMTVASYPWPMQEEIQEDPNFLFATAGATPLIWIEIIPALEML
jgi:hypothetical protein